MENKLIEVVEFKGGIVGLYFKYDNGGRPVYTIEYKKEGQPVTFAEFSSREAADHRLKQCARGL